MILRVDFLISEMNKVLSILMLLSDSKVLIRLFWKTMNSTDARLMTRKLTWILLAKAQKSHPIWTSKKISSRI